MVSNAFLARLQTGQGALARRLSGRFGKRPAHSRTVVRHPGDIIRVTLGTFVLSILGLIAQQGLAGTLELDVFLLINGLSDELVVPLNTLMQAGALPTVFVTAGLALLVRQLGLARNLIGAGTLAYALAKLVKLLVERARPEGFVDPIVAHGSVATGLGFPSGHVAVASALATAAGPYMSRPARRLMWAAVWVVAFGRIYFGAHLPLDVIGGAAMGWAIGATFNLVFGAPGGSTARHLVERALEDAGIASANLVRASVDARASTPFLVRTLTGSELFVKSYTPERRDADWLFRAWRFIAYRETRDEAPFLTLKQQIEHEAYASLLAYRVGVSTPAVVYAGQSKNKVGLLVQEKITASGLDSLPGDRIDDEMLRKIWSQVRTLRSARIAHRDLRRANVLVDTQGEPWIIDFGFAEVGASDRKLAGDVAEMLASLTALVGPERAVRSAIETLGGEAVRPALPLLQPLALSTATREDLKATPAGVLEEVRNQIASLLGCGAGQLETLTRIQRRTLLWMVMGAAAVFFLLPQVEGLGASLGALKSVQPWWLVAGAGLSMLTYVMAAVAMKGAVGGTLAFRPTLLVQVASSFVSRLTPQGIGGLALNERYLEKSGIGRATALASVALNGLAGFVMHMVLLSAVGVLVGSGSMLSFRLPANWPYLLAIALGVALLGLILRASLGNMVAVVTAPVVTAVRNLWGVLRRPRQAATLFGAAAGITLSYGLALIVSLMALGVDVSPLKVIAVYLGGSAVASASPTPGKLGAVEVALSAGLTAIGIESGVAVASVLIYRLLTFWLPVLPGFLAFRYLQKKQYI